MLQNKTARYVMFGSLYSSQGTVFSYFTSLNALYFLSTGLSMGDVGVFSAIALKLFWLFRVGLLKLDCIYAEQNFVGKC